MYQVVEICTPNVTKTDPVKSLVVTKKLRRVAATAGTRELMEESRICREARRRTSGGSGGFGGMWGERASSGGAYTVMTAADLVEA